MARIPLSSAAAVWLFVSLLLAPEARAQGLAKPPDRSAETLLVVTPVAQETLTLRPTEDGLAAKRSVAGESQPWFHYPVPDTAAVDGTHRYFGHWASREITVLSDGGQVLHRIGLPNAIRLPRGLLASDDLVMVTDAADGTLYLLDRAGEVLGERPLGTTFAFRDFAVLGSLLWLAGDGLVALDHRGDEVIRFDAFELGCGRVRSITALGNELLLGCLNGQVFRFSPRDHSVELFLERSDAILALAAKGDLDLVFFDSFEALAVDLLAPLNGAFVNTPNVVLEGTVTGDVLTLTLDGAPVSINAGGFTVPVSLTEGDNTFEFRATLQGGGEISVLVFLTLDTVPPAAVDLLRVDITPPDGGSARTEGLVGAVEAGAQVRITNTASSAIQVIPSSVSGSFLTQVVGSQGDVLELVAIDRAGNLSSPVSTPITALNQPPVLSMIGTQTVLLGRELRLTTTATDANAGDALLFSAAPLPSGASYDGMSGELRFRPTEAQVADFPVTFAVTDGKAMDTEAVTLSVQMPMGEVTTITGRVLDTTDFTADGTERAVEGAVVSILDSGVSDTTGPDGRFTLANVPSGLVLLDIATATANLAPDGAPYAGFREAISLIPDVINEFDRPFFLPRVAAESLTTVDPNSTTVVRNDTLGIRIEIPPNTAKSPDGSDYTGEMSISLVPDAVAPAALPEELGFGTLITIQPVGVYFDEPVPIFFPNTDGLPNGVEVDIWSLDPSLGQFAVVGQGQVNGNEIRTISGGVIAADWHGPLARLTGLEVPEDKDCDYCSKFRLLARLAPDVISGELPYDAELVSYRTDNGRTAYDIRYNSTAASGLTTLVSTSDVPRSAPASVQSQVRVGGVSGATSTGSSTANKAYGKGLPGPGEEFRTAGQIDFATLPTGLHEYEYRLTGRFQSSGVTATRTGRVPLVNRMSSDFGAGWGLLGHERLHFAEDGSAVLVDGNASSFVYRAQRAGTGRFGGQIALNIFPVNFPKGHSDPVVADFDGSGNLDIAVANTGFSSSVNTDEHITVFLGDGTGEFSQIRFDTGPGNIPSNMAGGFFDAGPTHDLVTVGNRVDLHLNNGDGTFQTPLSITGTGIRNAREVLVADFNKDGRSDIAYPNHNNTYVNPDTNYDVVLSDTGAGWLPPLTLSVGSNTRDGISGDFNGDTNPDLAVVFIGDASSSVGVYFGDGSGGFGPPTYYNPTDRPVDIEAGDINRDGHADLVLLDTSTDTVVTMVNDGSGGFSQFNSEMLGLGNSFRIEVADLDADTHPDVLVSLQGSNAAISLMNNGSGGFPETFNPFTVPVAGGLAVGEFTGDAALDLVVVGRQSGADHLAVVPGEGNGNFFPFQTVLTLGGNNAEEEFVKADFNDDGVTDLAIVNRTSIDMYLNTGSGFDRTRFNTVGTVGELAGGDFDGDGDVDLIRGTDPSSANVALYLNDGGGDLLSTRVNVPAPNARQLASGDLNHDMLDDLVVYRRINGSDSRVELLLNAAPQPGVVEQGGNPFIAGASFQTSSNDLPEEMMLGDVNGDGHIDVVATNFRDEVWVYFGDGLGGITGEMMSTFNAPASGESPKDAFLADFNNDGILDIAAGFTSTNTVINDPVRVLLGAGDGTFGGQLETPTCDQVIGIDATDMDGDGDLDLFVGCDDDEHFATLRNDGSGNFIPTAFPGSAFDVRGVVAIDYNGDGAPDLAGMHQEALLLYPAVPGPEVMGFRANPNNPVSLQDNMDGTFTRFFPTGAHNSYNADGYITSRTDDDGGVTSYGYNGQNQLTSVTDPNGGGTSLTYGGPGGRMDSITDPAGRRTDLTHDANGDLISIDYPDGSNRSFEYDSRHRMTAAVDELGNRTDFGYDPFGALQRISQPDGSAHTLQPLTSELLSAGFGTPGGTRAILTDADLRRQELEADRCLRIKALEEPFDLSSLPAKVSQAAAGKGGVTMLRTERFYNARGYLTREITPDGVETVQSYDDNGNLVRLTEASGMPLERTTLFEYDPMVSEPVRIIDANGNETLIERDAGGRATRLTDQGGNEQTFVYDAQGRLQTFTDANTHTVDYTYDAMGNVASITNGDGTVISYVRDSAGNITTTTAAVGQAEEAVQLFTYDSRDRELTATDRAGNTRRRDYDDRGNVIRRENESGESWEYDYDSLGRVSQVRSPSIGTRSFTYTPGGRLLSAIEGTGGRVDNEYDVAGQLVRTIDQLGNIQSYRYDVSGRLTSIADGSGNETLFTYDDLGRRTEIRDAAGETELFEYDALNNMVRRTRPGGAVVDYTYTPTMRLESISTGGDTISYSYDGVGNLLSAEDSDSELVFTYGPDGKMSSAVTGPGGAQPEVTFTYAHNRLGYRTGLAESTGAASGYQRSPSGLIEQLTTAAGPVIGFSHDSYGRTTQVRYPNGVEVNASYNAITGRLDRMTHGLPGTPFIDLEYTYNGSGDVASRALNGSPVTYTYDAKRQVIATSDGEAYQYDPEGNRVASHLSVAYTTEAGNRLTADGTFSYGYDEVGRLVSRTELGSSYSETFVWNALDQLLSHTATDGAVTTYQYDGLSRLFGVNQDGVQRYFIYDGGNRRLEYDGSGMLLARYEFSDALDRPLSMQRDGQSYYYHGDYVGSVLAVTSATGSVVNDYRYDSFGNLTQNVAAVTNPFLFQGRPLDAQSGLYQFRARWLDPVTGRFTSPDPLGISGRDSNLYGFVGNNPVSLVDPSGLESKALSTGLDAIIAGGGLLDAAGAPGLGPLALVGAGKYLYDTANRTEPIDGVVIADGVVNAAGVGLFGASISSGAAVFPPAGIAIAVYGASRFAIDRYVDHLDAENRRANAEAREKTATIRERSRKRTIAELDQGLKRYFAICIRELELRGDLTDYQKKVLNSLLNIGFESELRLIDLEIQSQRNAEETEIDQCVDSASTTGQVKAR